MQSRAFVENVRVVILRFNAAHGGQQETTKAVAVQDWAGPVGITVPKPGGQGDL
jgi:hypothetical protein